jgi:hypothetical protein
MTAASNTPSVIALFGCGGCTAHHFLKLALDAGYRIRALLLLPTFTTAYREIPNKITDRSKALLEEYADQEFVEFVTAESVYDAKACRRVLQDADFVVCFMNDAPLCCEILNDKKNTSASTIRQLSSSMSISNACKNIPPEAYKKPLTTFLEMLYPLMIERQQSIQVFLYQATSLSSDVRGKTPMFSKVLKTASVVGDIVRPGGKSSNTLDSNHQDLDSAIQVIAKHHHRTMTKQIPDKDHNTENVARGTKQSTSTISQHRTSMGSTSRASTDIDDSSSIKENDPSLSSSTTTNSSRFLSRTKAQFSYIVTRPTTFLKDGPSTKKVSASKSVS